MRDQGENPVTNSILGTIKKYISSKTALNIMRVIIFIGVIGLTAYLFTIRDQLQKLQGYGYVGIFLLSILANATIIVPVPGVILASAMATIFNPLGVAIAAGSGAALGELTGYLAGFSGQGVMENSRRYTRILKWMKNHRRLTDLAILALAAIPNPFFDLAGMASGALKIPIWRFLLLVWLGKIIKMLPFAYAGSPILSFISSLLTRLHLIK